MKDSLIEKLQAQFDKTLKEFHAEECADHAAERKRIKAARTQAGKVPTKAWDETYAIQVRHSPTRNGRGREATISAPGVKTKILVRQQDDMLVNQYQTSKRNRYQGRYVNKSNPNVSWKIFINDDKDNTLLQSNVTDFDSAVQQAIVTLLGHMYYDL